MILQTTLQLLESEPGRAAWCLDGSSKCHSVIYMLSLKPRILLAPAGPSLYCVTGHEWSSTDRGLVCASRQRGAIQVYFPVQRSSRVLSLLWNVRTAGSTTLQIYKPLARWQILFPCMAHRSQTAPAPIFPAERRALFTWLQLNVFKAVSVCGRWSYYSFYQNFEDLILFTHLINRWLSAVERGLLN